jgi:hypothetical protein
MVATNFGAMYASREGLIALTSDSETVASRDVAVFEDDLPLVKASGAVVNAKLYDITRAGWWNGNYFGFLSVDGLGFVYMFNQQSPANVDLPLGRLVTLDAPAATVVDTIATGSGFFGVWSNGVVYKLPLQGYGYNEAPKAKYTWKSKRFVMVGLTTFAGMKIVNSNSGDLTVTLSGYNDGGSTVPSFTFTRTLNHSKPFRLPHNHKCLEWEIQVSGTAVVQEIHLSTSYQDLIEDSNNNVSSNGNPQ